MKKILSALVFLAAAVIIGGSLLPGEVEMERGTVIAAPQCTVFALTNGYALINEWSPWTQIDPDGTTYEFSGPNQGVGARMAWSSEHPEVGVGSQEITVSVPFKEVRSKLIFEGQGDADAYFLLEPTAQAEGDDGATGVDVRWGFSSELGRNPINRIFGFFFLEGMLGPQYEQGLAQLKTFAESMPDTDWCDMEAELLDVESQTVAYVEASSSLEHAEIAATYGKSYGQIMAFMGEHGLQGAGPPLSINKSWGETYEFEPGIPVLTAPEDMPEDSAVKIGQTYAGKAVRAIHVGPYGELAKTYGKVDAMIKVRGLTKSGSPWDVWISDPSQTPEAELVTHVYVPVE